MEKGQCIKMRTIQSEMKRNGMTEKNNADPPAPKPKKKVKEQFSRWEVEELMGMRRDKFTRRHGAIRKK